MANLVKILFCNGPRAERRALCQRVPLTQSGQPVKENVVYTGSVIDSRFYPDGDILLMVRLISPKMYSGQLIDINSDRDLISTLSAPDPYRFQEELTDKLKKKSHPTLQELASLAISTKDIENIKKYYMRNPMLQSYVDYSTERPCPEPDPYFGEISQIEMNEQEPFPYIDPIDPYPFIDPTLDGGKRKKTKRKKLQKNKRTKKRRILKKLKKIKNII